MSPFPPERRSLNPLPPPLTRLEAPAPANPDTTGPVPVNPFSPDPNKAAKAGLDPAKLARAPAEIPDPPNPSSVPSGLVARLLSCLSCSSLAKTKQPRHKMMLRQMTDVFMVICMTGSWVAISCIYMALST